MRRRLTRPFSISVWMTALCFPLRESCGRRASRSCSSPATARTWFLQSLQQRFISSSHGAVGICARTLPVSCRGRIRRLRIQTLPAVFDRSRNAFSPQCLVAPYRYKGEERDTHRDRRHSGYARAARLRQRPGQAAQPRYVHCPCRASSGFDPWQEASAAETKASLASKDEGFRFAASVVLGTSVELRVPHVLVMPLWRRDRGIQNSRAAMHAAHIVYSCSIPDHPKLDDIRPAPANRAVVYFAG
jgi:hypothetical protein